MFFLVIKFSLIKNNIIITLFVNLKKIINYLNFNNKKLILL